MVYHPLFGSSPEEQEIRKQEQAQELKRMMELIWTKGGIANSFRPAKSLMPMKFGSLWGYYDTICRF